MTTGRALDTASRGSTARAGFTLIEMLLAMSLGVVLLAALWSGLSMYLRLFEAGRSSAESSQLVRAVLDQMANDLRSAAGSRVPDQETGEPRVPHFVGSAHALEFDAAKVASPLPPRARAGGPGERRGAASDAPRPALPGELTTVSYRMLTDSLAGRSRSSRDRDLATAFVRYETPRLSLSQTAPGRSLSGSGNSFMSTSFAEPGELPQSRSAREESLGDRESLGEGSEEPGVLRIPEVASVELRYFDGTAWTTTWDSRVRGGLPRGVEIVLALYARQSARDRRRAAQSRPVENDADASELPSHRLFVLLPLSGGNEDAELQRGSSSRVQQAANFENVTDQNNSSEPSTAFP